MYQEHKKNFIKLAKEVGYKHGTWEVFSDFLELSAISIRNTVEFNETVKAEYEKMYLEIARRYSKEELEKLAAMLGEVVLGLEAGISDMLGEIYQELDLASKWNGQYFTPMHICEFMAKMSLESSTVSEELERKGFITVAEPACGGGAMILAAAKVFNEMGRNAQQEMVVYAKDIDIRAVHMCYIQLSLIGIPAMVVCGNGLTDEVRSEWLTPFYVLGLWDSRLRIAKSIEDKRTLINKDDEKQKEPQANTEVLKKESDISLPSKEEIKKTLKQVQQMSIFDMV